MAHIFVVDDDEQLLRMVGLMLERGNHTATLVSNPIESLEMMREEPPDLAILDVMMPGMNGLELCRELRQDPDTYHVPVIILTARGPIEDRNEALEIGADNYINKPVTSMELLNHVDHLLKNPPERTAPHTQTINETVDLVADVSDSEPDYADEASMSFAVYGFTGGSGRTTVAANLVAQLHHKYPGEACLVDLTTSGSQAAMHFRLQPRRTWEGLMVPDAPPSVYDLLMEHESGVRVLAAPIVPVVSTAMGLKVAQQIFEELTSEFRFVVFDLPSVSTPATNYILENVDTALHIIRPEVMSIQTAVRTLRWLNTKGPSIANNVLVLNQTVAEAQLNQAIVKRGLGTEIDYAVGYDSSQSKALVQGRPLSLKANQADKVPTGPLQLTIAQMVESLLALIPARA